MSEEVFHTFPKRGCRTFGVLNSFPRPSGESCCALRARPRLELSFSKTAKLCFVASSESLNLNSGTEGVLQGVPITCLMQAINLLGQSKCWVVVKLFIASRTLCLRSGEKGKSH
jgi:hypothetical protein